MKADIPGGTVALTENADWALILGASSGIGLASAKRLAVDGYNLCLVFRETRSRAKQVDAELAELAKGGVRVLPLNLDATSDSGREAALRALSAEMRVGERVKLLLHSIARGNLKPLRVDPETQIFDERRPGENPVASVLSTADFRFTIEAMGISAYSWIAALHAGQLFAADARVLALTSDGARRVWNGYAAVSAAKATLEAVVRAVAVELGPAGIRANLIQSGIVDTPSLRRLPESETLLRLAAEKNPLGRVTRPEDVARVVSLLCRADAAWINGSVICVDGGEHLC